MIKDWLCKEGWKCREWDNGCFPPLCESVLMMPSFSPLYYQCTLDHSSCIDDLMHPKLTLCMVPTAIKGNLRCQRVKLSIAMNAKEHEDARLEDARLVPVKGFVQIC